jgi:uncharacterized protein (TIGR02646 family)
MLKVNKASEPVLFQKLKKNRRIKAWDDFYRPENRDLLERLQQHVKLHMLDHEQTYNGTWLCPYCERKVDLEGTHIEHIKPRGRPEFHSLEFAYENLLVSCDDPNTCGKYKKNRWENTFINPVDEDPIPYFHYSANGKIREDDVRVRDTVSILNLNHDALVGIRRTMLLKMKSYPENFIEDLDKYFPDFPSFILYYQHHYHHL